MDWHLLGPSWTWRVMNIDIVSGCRRPVIRAVLVESSHCQCWIFAQCIQTFWNQPIGWTDKHQNLRRNSICDSFWRKHVAFVLGARVSAQPSCNRRIVRSSSRQTETTGFVKVIASKLHIRFDAAADAADTTIRLVSSLILDYPCWVSHLPYRLWGRILRVKVACSRNCFTINEILCRKSAGAISGFFGRISTWPNKLFGTGDRSSHSLNNRDVPSIAVIHKAREIIRPRISDLNLFPARREFYKRWNADGVTFSTQRSWWRALSPAPCRHHVGSEPNSRSIRSVVTDTRYGATFSNSYRDQTGSPKIEKL